MHVWKRAKARPMKRESAEMISFTLRIAIL
jgi:hypothetical protein